MDGSPLQALMCNTVIELAGLLGLAREAGKKHSVTKSMPQL